MEKQEEYAKALKEYENQSDKNRNFSRVLEENLDKPKHIMLIEEKKFKSGLKFTQKLRKENALLEKVDLIDYWKLENGRTNKSR